MATTTNGIYYPNDYDSVADIPADMKKIAESVDTKISENKTEINNIKTEQTTQNTNISNLQKDNTTNKQDITNIKAKDTEQDKYIAELEAENTRLRQDLNGLPKGQASGESIDLNDSAEMRCELKISGNSKQETREGYNLLNFKKWKDNNVSWNLGKNIVYGDNYVSGTSEGTDCYSNTVNEQYRFNCEPNTTYTLFYINDNSIMCRPIAFVYDSESKNIQTKELGLSADNIIIRRFTTSSEAGKMAIRLGTNVDGVNFKFSNIMILKGIYDKSTIPNYEQYGASPSPDYPSEVECCGDNVNIIDCVSVHGYANASGQIDLNASTNYLSVPNMLEANPNTTYTIDFVGYKDGYLLVSEYDESKAFIKRTQYSTRTFTTSSNCRYVFIHLYNSVADAFSTIGTKIKMVEGTSTGAYSPYGQGCINEVICNKNLFNKNDVTNGMYINRNTGFISTGTDATNYSTSGFCKVKSNTQYYLGISYSSSNYGVVYYDKSKNHLSGERLSNTFTTPDNCEYVRFTWITANYDVSKIQIEEGTTATSYEEHQSQTYTIPTQQPMRAIRDVRDKFILKENGKWYERHNIARKIFDGTENFNLGTNANSLIYFFTNAGSIKAKSQDLLCNKLTTVTNLWNETENKNLIAIRSALDLFNIMLSDTTINTVEKFKSWLSEQYNAGTPVYVDYILETPTDIECTEEQSTILFDIEQNAKTYDKVTHMYSTDNVSPVIDVTYKKDIETLFANTLVEGV